MDSSRRRPPMTDLLSCATLKGAQRTKKHHQRILRGAGGKPTIAQSKEYIQYEKDCLWQIRSPPRPLSGPVNVKCLYYMPTRRRVDLTNLLESTGDILMRAGDPANDCAAVVAGHDGSRELLVGKNPRVEIEIKEGGKA